MGRSSLGEQGHDDSFPYLVFLRHVGAPELLPNISSQLPAPTTLGIYCFSFANE